MIKILKAIVLIGFIENVYGLNADSVLYEISWLHGKYGRDSIVVSGISDGYYGKIQIFNNGKNIYSSKKENLEIEAYAGKIVVQEFSGDTITYVVTISDRPAPNKYLVLTELGGKIVSEYITENSTAEILSDIDYDGKLELSGMNGWIELESSEDTISDNDYISRYRSYKLGITLERNRELEKLMLSQILKKKK